MTVLITLTTAGAATGPFNLYSNVNGYLVAFETNVSKASLVAGYTSVLVPDGTTTIRVQSAGACTNYVDILVGTIPPSTTTTTTAVPTTTTTTTSGGPTTTTTTTAYTGCTCYGVSNSGDTTRNITYTPCGDTVPTFSSVIPYGNITICVALGYPIVGDTDITYGQCINQTCSPESPTCPGICIRSEV